MIRWEPGAQIGSYTLIETVGAGGMGEVWKARDTRLERTVAVKRLRETIRGLDREARAIAALNHPHICTIHDVGDDYFVMEYLEGRPASGPLLPHDASRLALQIASALEAAHEKGIVHCDLKPVNVIVSGGRAKLVDFGIARLRRTGGADVTLTAEIGTTGTPAYMSPEQIRGDAPDPRWDVFSFGALLYELLSGRRAFPGATAGEVFGAVLRDQPAPLSGPDALVRIVRRCLEKSPADRFQSMADLTAALEAASVEGAAQTPSIAVLPFANMSSDPEQEYFSDGLTEEIINALAHVPGLKVIARTSAFAFKGQNVDIRRIAETLGVTNVLEGSVRKGGNRIRIMAQLIKVEDGCHLWSERYDRDLTDVFAVQDEIAAAITQELRGTLAIRSGPPRAHTPNVDAYQAYLMGRHHMWNLTPDSLARSRRAFEQAIAMDAEYALPHVGLAELNYILSTGVGPSARACQSHVEQSAKRALALDPNLAAAHAWLGVVEVHKYRWAEAGQHFRLTSTDTPTVRHFRGYFYLRLIGREAEAVSDHEAMLHADPLSLIGRAGYVVVLLSAGRLSEAAAESRRLMELAPDFAATYTLLAFDLIAATPEDALAYAERGYARAPWSPGMTGLLAGMQRRAGNESRAQALLQEIGDVNEYGRSVDMALFHLASGETDKAMDWIEATVDQHHPFAMMILVGGPYGSLIQSSPRWPTLATRLNLPPT